ncbi:hypothetical protein [Streptomyces sp. NPDC058953]|uniref:hypothetical protein n=1 Tax=Streptomyces sp. NPDC058953 TaxID=3346676 RepID=UPI003682F67E
MTPEPVNPDPEPGTAPQAPPVVRTSGSPRDRGRQYGAAARRRVQLSLESYEGMYAHFAGLDWAAATALAETFVPVIEAFDADYLEEIGGIADGAGVAFPDVLALNLRTEILFSARARTAGGGGGPRPRARPPPGSGARAGGGRPPYALPAPPPRGRTPEAPGRRPARAPTPGLCCLRADSLVICLVRHPGILRMSTTRSRRADP